MGQSVQAALDMAPGSVANFPALQLVQNGLGDTAYDPARHCLHTALLFAASAALAVPAGQRVQRVNCGRPTEAPYVPKGQGSLGAAPPVQKYPKGQIWPWGSLEAALHAYPGAEVQLKHSEELLAPIKVVWVPSGQALHTK